MIMTTRNGWTNDWENDQDDKYEELARFSRVETPTPANPLAKIPLSDLIKEVIKRLTEQGLISGIDSV